MSYAKELLERKQENGFDDCDKRVCSNCFCDKYINEIIETRNEYGTCSYCGDYTKTIELTDIFYIFKEYISHNYQSIINYPSLEDEKTDIDEIIYNIFSKIDSSHDALLYDFIESFDDRSYISNEKLYMDDTFYQLKFGWDNYCDSIEKNDLSVNEIVTQCINDTKTERIEEIDNTLSEIVNLIEKYNLVNTITKDTNIYRCVTYIDKVCDISKLNAKSIGTAPSSKAATNRMSENGDEYFYGTLDINTSKIEAIDEGKCKTIGTFHPNNDIQIIDINKIGTIDNPSVLDLAKSEKLLICSFLRYLSYEISAPVENDKDIKYKPTQVFAKYIQRKTDFKGIKYASSKNNEESCVALFVKNKDCIDYDETVDSSKIQLIMSKNVCQE